MALELACPEGSSQLAEARIRLRELDERMASESDGRSLTAALSALRQSRCFEPSVEHREPIESDDAEVVRYWWIRGGMRWLSSYVHGCETAWGYCPTVLPPSPRPTLWLDESDGRLGPLLCARADQDCGGETEAWLQAAQWGMERVAFERGQWRSRLHPHFTVTGLSGDEVGTECAKLVDERDIVPSYPRWRECVESRRSRTGLLPAGRFRAPTTGWLVTEHIVFSPCMQRSAYDLETGSVHRARVCSVGDGQPTIEVETGMVSPERVREVLLLSVLAEHAVEGAPIMEAFDIPHGLSPGWPPGHPNPQPWPEVPRSFVDHDLTIRFLWFDHLAVVSERFEGRLEGRHHGSVAEAYAQSLHRLLELATQPAAPAVGLPPQLRLDDDGRSTR